MANGKQLIVLSGSGRKGIVKLSLIAGGAKGSCSLDFRPVGATLYLIGDEIAQIALKDINTTFEVPFLSNGDISCLVRSSSCTMFGGNMSHSDMLKRADEFCKRSAQKRASRSTSDVAPDDGAQAVAPSLFNGCEGQESASPQNSQTERPSSDNARDAAEEPEAAYDTPQSDEASVKPQATRSENALKDWTRFDGNNFYYAIKPQLDEMFVRYPEDEALGAAVQSSKWVRVDAADGAYSVGILFDGDEPTFVCYAVPEYVQNRRPPAEIEDMCVWLPAASGDICGYWVIYQSAHTGEIIK